MNRLRKIIIKVILLFLLVISLRKTGRNNESKTCLNKTEEIIKIIISKRRRKQMIEMTKDEKRQIKHAKPSTQCHKSFL